MVTSQLVLGMITESEDIDMLILREPRKDRVVLAGQFLVSRLMPDDMASGGSLMSMVS